MRELNHGQGVDVRWLIGALLATALFFFVVQPATAGSKKTDEAGDFIERNIELTVRPLDLDQLCARLHAKITSSRDEPDLYASGKTDRIVIVSAPGVEVEAYVVAGAPVVIDRIQVGAGGPPLPEPLRIGKSTADEVRSVLGKEGEDARNEDGSAALRYFNFSHTASVLLWFDDRQHLAGVRWLFEGD